MKRAVAVLALLLGTASHDYAAGPARLPEALAAQRELVATSPGDLGALNDLANLLVLDGQLDEAESLYRQAADLAPEVAMIPYNLGLLLQQRDRHEEAITEFQRVVELTPENAWGHYQLGLSFEAVGGEEKAAIDSYAAAFSLDPRLAFADVNPQVIDSRYLTVAMLQAHRQAPDRVVAPLSYQEPERIAAILLPAPSTEADDARQGEASPVHSEAPVDAALPGGQSPTTAEPGLGDDLTEAERQRARAVARSRHLRAPTHRATPPAEVPSRALPTEDDEADQPFEDRSGETDPDASDNFFEDFSPRQESTGRIELRLLPATGASEDDPDSLAINSTQAAARAR